MKDKWQTLEHNGPLFPAEYEYVGFDPKLSHLAEEMLYHYSAKLETDYVHNTTFNKNFFEALHKELPTEYKNRKLEDFLPLCKAIFDHIQKKKEDKKNRSKEEREQEVKNKQLIKEKYGYCVLNGEKQPIASFLIEPPGLFIGRGAHPQTGAVKFRVKPEDVNINASNKVQPPSGHKWKSCKENKSSMELCSYKMKTSTGMILHKRVLFSATSIVKQNADQKKFEKAIKLLSKWEQVKSHIEKGFTSKDFKVQQTAFVSYLIMNLGIRVGDEKDEDYADTVGASTLRKEHVTLKDNTIYFDFLGKDSVRYTNKLELSDNAKIVFSKIYSNTKDGQMLFPDATSHDITEFISSVVEGVTAKVFRTAWGSSLLAKELRNSVIKDSFTQTEKVAVFNEANLIVAKKLNHQKNVGKNNIESENKLNEKQVELEQQFKIDEQTFNDEIKKINYQIKTVSDSLSENDKKALILMYKEKIEKLTIKFNKKKNRLNDFYIKKNLKDKTKNIALGTSKTSYCDPRIGISWCKSIDIPIDRVYNKTMQNKFSWALDCEEDFYKNYTII